MKKNHVITCILAVVFSIAASQSYATSWGDYSSSNSLISITSSNYNNATILRRVTVVCPASGFLVAHADAGFSLHPTAIGNRVWIRYGISRDNVGGVGIDANHHHSLQEFVMNDPHSTPGSIMRMDRCSADETVTYQFVAQRVSNADANTAAVRPRLFVEFINRRI